MALNVEEDNWPVPEAESESGTDGAGGDSSAEDEKVLPLKGGTRKGKQAKMHQKKRPIFEWQISKEEKIKIWAHFEQALLTFKVPRQGNTSVSEGI